MTDGTRPDMVFVSKRDWWISTIIWAGVALQAAGMAAAVAAAESAMGSALMLLFVLAVASFMLWVLYGTRYTFRRGDLVIQAGPFRWRVKVAAIRGVEPTRNPLSSPACSLDRLRIEHEGSRWGIMISPLEKTDFLEELVVRNPALEIAGDRVVRRTGTDGAV